VPTTADILLVAPRAIDADAARFAIARCAPRARIIWLKSADEALQYVFCAGDFAASGLRLPAIAFIEEIMPVADGVCLAEILKAHPRTRRIPLVLLAATKNALGASGSFTPDHRIFKPCDLHHYRRAVREALETLAPWLVHQHSRKVVGLAHRKPRTAEAAVRSGALDRAFGNL
jgi:CheY-like chemotaxis protein